LLAQQTDTLVYSLNARLNPGVGTFAPFLSTANQYDRHGFTPNSLSLWGTIGKSIATQKTFDYGFGVELNSNVSPTQHRFFPGELYIEGKVGPFLANLGMKRDPIGNQDSELSSGNILNSQNSRPIPALTIETNGYMDVPFTKGYLEWMGGMANGWFSDKTDTKNTLLHHKWLFLRLGGSLPVTVNYGVNHVAQWGGDSRNFGNSPVTFDNFMRIFFARGGGSSAPATEFYNILGNHIVSQQIGFSLKLPEWSADFYWQDISETGPIYAFWDTYYKKDGLWGLSLRVPRFRALHSLALEVLSTTNQGGPWHDLDGIVFGGTNNYFNNSVYPNGWSFYGMTIGNPWLTSPKYNSDGAVIFENNSLRMFYLSALGEICQTKYRLTTAYSINYGNPDKLYAFPKKQFSGQLDVFHTLPFLQNAEGSLSISGDRGSLYGNNLALLIGFRYTGLFILNKH
jgi:hypothetical protein